MFIASLLIIVKIWKQPKCPSRDEWIKRDVAVYPCMHTHTHTHTDAMKYYSEMLPLVASSMDLEVIVTSEKSQTKTNTV